MKNKLIESLAETVSSKGSISIGLDTYKNKDYQYEQYRISGEQDTLKIYQKMFGGTVSSNGKKCKWIWRITADKAHKMFNAVRPYIKNNTELIDALIEFGNVRKELASIVWNVDGRDKKKNEFVRKANELRNIIRECRAQIEN